MFIFQVMDYLWLAFASQQAELMLI